MRFIPPPCNNPASTSIFIFHINKHKFKFWLIFIWDHANANICMISCIKMLDAMLIGKIKWNDLWRNTKQTDWNGISLIFIPFKFNPIVPKYYNSIEIFTIDLYFEFDHGATAIGNAPDTAYTSWIFAPSINKIPQSRMKLFPAQTAIVVFSGYDLYSWPWC